VKVDRVEDIDSVLIAELIAHLGLDAVKRQVPELFQVVEVCLLLVPAMHKL
jgi:hypothetical protein